MRYSIEPRNKIYVKGCGFLSSAKNMSKNLGNKYSQELFDSAKKWITDAIKTASKKTIQKTAEATGDLIDNKFADKITSVSMELNTQNNDVNNEIEVPKERYMSPEKGQQIIDELTSTII